MIELTRRVKWLYIALWVSYVAFSLTCFPAFNSHVGIPGLGLVALGSWLFGIASGYMLTIGVMLNHFLLSSIIYPHLTLFYEDRFTGPMILILLSWLAGSHKKSQTKLKNATTTLELNIKKRNSELSALSEKLINANERMRIEMGETLHDSIGQELTGIQLFCGSIAEKLQSQNNESAPLAQTIQTGTSGIHNVLRIASRTLFPVNLAQTGLPIALNELVACLQETKNIRFSISGHEALQQIQEPLSLQIYRICQEAALLFITKAAADDLQISITKENTAYRIEISQNGIELDVEHIQDIKIIRYRLKRLGGTLQASTTPDRTQHLCCLIPIQEGPRTP